LLNPDPTPKLGQVYKNITGRIRVWIRPDPDPTTIKVHLFPYLHTKKKQEEQMKKVKFCRFFARFLKIKIRSRVCCRLSQGMIVQTFVPRSTHRMLTGSSYNCYRYNFFAEINNCGGLLNNSYYGMKDICTVICGEEAKKSSKWFYNSAPKVEQYYFQSLTSLACVHIKYILHTAMLPVSTRNIKIFLRSIPITYRFLHQVQEFCDTYKIGFSPN
jgi:hypothetical protein